MVCYNFFDLFLYIIRIWNEEKKGKFFIYFKKEKKEKEKTELDSRPPDSESDVLL